MGSSGEGEREREREVVEREYFPLPPLSPSILLPFLVPEAEREGGREVEEREREREVAERVRETKRRGRESGK